MAPQKNFSDFCWTFVLPLILVIVISSLLFVTGYKYEAILISYIGPLLIILGCLVFIVFTDSRNRSPNATLFRRLVNVLTFRY